MSAPISLADRRAAPLREGVIELLERALEEARSGDLKAVVLVKVHRTDEFQAVSDGDVSISRLIGLIEIAKHDLLERERARPPVDAPS